MTPSTMFEGLMAGLDAPDPDAALADLASSLRVAERWPAAPADQPLAGIALVMMVNGLARSGRGGGIRPLLEAVADAFDDGRRARGTGTGFGDLALRCPVVSVAAIVAAIAGRDWLGAARAVDRFAADARDDASGGLPASAGVAEVLGHPAAAARGPFRYDPAWVLDRQEDIARAGALDRRLEVVRQFEQVLVENALLVRQPERALPVIETLGDAYVPVGDARGGHLEFDAVCALAALGRFDDALRLARAIVRHGYPLRWRFDLARAADRPWTQDMGQNEWLGALAETPAYRDFLRGEIVPEPFPVDDPGANALIAARDGVWEGRTARRCWLSRAPIAPGDPVVRVRRLVGHSDEGAFDIAASGAFAASGWAEARRRFDADRIPLAALFPEPRGQRRTWHTPAIAALHHDLARGAALDLDRAARIVADHAPNPIRLEWLCGRYRYGPAPEPMVGDRGHGEAVNLVWRLIKAGHAEALFDRWARLPQADQVFAMLGTFDRDDCRRAAAAHFALPELPALMGLAFAERPSLDDHLGLAAFGQAQPRWRAGLAAAMRAYALHLYSNGHPGVDWFLEGLEPYGRARCCHLLFFLIHHPEDDPVLSAMLERNWLPTSGGLGGHDAYGNGQAFYVRAAMFHLMLHAPERLDAWLTSDWMAFYCDTSKDRDTRRMVERWRKAAARSARQPRN